MRRRRECRNLLRLLVVERDVGDEVAQHREGAHRRDRDRLGRFEDRQPGHAQQSRPSVDFSAARPTFASLAIPTDGEVAGLRGLQPMNRVEDNLALLDPDRVVDKVATGFVAPPYPHLEVVAHQWLSSSNALSSSGMTGRSW